MSHKKIAFTSDLHLGARPMGSDLLAKNLFHSFDLVLRTALEQGATHLHVVGDFFDSVKPSETVVSFARKIVDDYRGKIEITAIAGDHDRQDGKSQCSWVNSVLGLAVAPEGVFSIPFTGDMPSELKKAEGFLRSKTGAEAAAKISILCLHGIYEPLFSFVTPSKALDMVILDWLPNVQAVVLGDIHGPLQGKHRTTDGRQVWVMYCNSPGVVKHHEHTQIGAGKGILIWENGKTPERIIFDKKHFPIFVDLDMTNVDDFDPAKHQTDHGLVVRLVVDVVDTMVQSKMATLAEKLNKTVHELRLVKTTGKSQADDKTSVNIRSEIRDRSRYEEILGHVLSNSELAAITARLLREDPRVVLTELKTKKLCS